MFLSCADFFCHNKISGAIFHFLMKKKNNLPSPQVTGRWQDATLCFMTFPMETGVNVYSPQKENRWQTKVMFPPRSNFGDPMCLVGLFTRVWMKNYLEDWVTQRQMYHPKVHCSLCDSSWNWIHGAFQTTHKQLDRSDSLLTSAIVTA